MLEVENIRAGYGDINILWDVSVTFETGKLTTIIGTNGAGKTTLLRAILGLIPLSQGRIALDDQPLDKLSTWDLTEQGISLIPEGRMVFKEMSVEENLQMGAYPRRSRMQVGSNLERVYQRFPKLKERRRQLAGSLSGGEAQMLAMGRGLMSEPQIILIDEPSLGLAPVIVNDIFAILKTLKDEGKTIVLVEQNTHRAVGIADHVYLMQSGKIILSQEADTVDLDALHKLYFAQA
ncbi:ABC transporter ATP-binding protein [Castellaniella sp.]|uniref:ABC transporter ATP-binding protein n=1 Tax=Castellaniella sp. TaxID=1955812 RepID=UPI003C71F43B